MNQLNYLETTHTDKNMIEKFNISPRDLVQGQLLKVIGVTTGVYFNLLGHSLADLQVTILEQVKQKMINT